MEEPAIIAALCFERKADGEGRRAISTHMMKAKERCGTGASRERTVEILHLTSVVLEVRFHKNDV